MKRITVYTSLCLVLLTCKLYAQNFWVNTNASLGSKVTAIVINSYNEIFASTESNGIHFSSDYGETWISVNNGLTSNTILSLAVSPITQTLTALDYSGIFRSTDNGTSWSSIAGTIFTMNLDCNLNGDFFGGTPVNGVIRSTDDGLTWQLTNSGLTQFSIYSFGFADSVMVFCSSYDATVYRSTNYGDSWTSIFLPAGSGDVNSLAAYNGILYAGTGGQGVFATDYNQINWEVKNNGLLSTNIRKIKINSNGYLYVLTLNGGIYRSLDSGNGWHEFNSGLTELTVSSLALAPDGFLYCGTESGKIFRSSSTTSVDEGEEVIAESFILNQNYPNPFNPTTTINYSLPVTGFVTLKVYDVLGNEVRTLVKEEKSAGSHKAEFRADGLTSGIYFYRLQSGDFVESIKMILLK